MEYNSKVVWLSGPCHPSVCLIAHWGSEASGLVCCCAWFPKAGNCLAQGRGSGWAFGNLCRTSLKGEETGAKCLLEGTEICVWRADTGGVWFDVYRSLERGKE